MIPNTSKDTRPVSQYIRLISAIPRITLPRFWGMIPSWRWGETMKLWKRARSVEKGLLWTILRAPVGIPLSPLTGVAKLARRVGSIAREEIDEETRLQETLLSLQMRRELGEIDEEEFVKQAKAIGKKLEERKGAS